MIRTDCWKALLVSGLLLAMGCRGHQKKPPPPPPGQMALKVAYVDLAGWGAYKKAWLISPLTAEKFIPPKYAYHSTSVVAFDPKLPFPRSLRVIWSTWDDAFSSYLIGDGKGHQMTVKEWGHDVTTTVEGPVPANPEHLLLIFYPEDKVKAEILSQAQMDAGRMDQVIEEFRKTWPGIIPPKEEKGRVSEKRSKKKSAVEKGES